MSKDRKREVIEPTEKEPEAPAHKKRRQSRQQLREIVETDNTDLDEFEIETFEPIRRRNRK